MNASASAAALGVTEVAPSRGGGRLPLNATFPMVAVGGCLTVFCVMFCCYLCRLRRQRAEEVGYTRMAYKAKKSYGTNLTDANAERCPVCLEDFLHRDEIATCKCKHAFHFSCLTTWLKEQQNCPVCKTPVGCQKHCAGTSAHDDVEAQRNGSDGTRASADGSLWRLVSPLGHAVRAPLVPARLADTA